MMFNLLDLDQVRLGLQRFNKAEGIIEMLAVVVVLLVVV
jgi:hypothetical protein